MKNDTLICEKYIFADDSLKQREHIEAAYADVIKKGGGIIISKETLEKYRGIFNDPAIKLAAAIREYYKENLQEKSVAVKIKDGIVEIGFGSDGRDKSTFGNKMTPERAATFEHLEKLLETGVYAYSQENRKAKDDRTYAKYVPYFHYFVNNANVDEVDIPIKIQVREMNLQGKTECRYYTHGFIKNGGDASSGFTNNFIGSGKTRNVSPTTTI